MISNMPMLYNRDLSWLGFNFRILMEAAERQLPLFERIRFLSIYSSNMNEFFRVRYPSIVALSKLGRKTRMSASSDEDILEKIQAEISRQSDIYKALLNNEIINDLEKAGIVLYWNSPVLNEHLPEIKELFLSKVLSFMRPVFIDKEDSQFMPANNKLYFVVTLRQAGQTSTQLAIVNIPSNKLSRFFTLPEVAGAKYVILIDDVIRLNLQCLFPGYDIESIYSIKLNRDAELRLADEYSGDLLNKIEKQLAKRDVGPASRFMFEEGMPRNIQLYLAGLFGVKHDEMFVGGRYHNLDDLKDFPVFDKSMEFPPFKPVGSKDILDCGDIFQVMNTKDILLHLPYESYSPVLSFFNQAAVDPDVTEIYITLYRAAAGSHIVNALISAAQNGKKVTAFIELKARFDEENNIKWSRLMEEAGVKILYSIPKIKVHSKIGLVCKRSPQGTVKYGILSTGNFNEITARFYTDHVLLTTDPLITADMLQLFDYLSKKHKADKELIHFESLYVSQFNLVLYFIKQVDRQIENVKEGGEGLIRIKVNNLEEPFIIEQLYRASENGVKVNLIVRSICCLIPGKQGVSENIIVKRIVGRFLEHSRIFIFGKDDESEVLMGSADLMTRNLHARIEVCTAIKDEVLKKEMLSYFELQWADTAKAVVLNECMEQERCLTDETNQIEAQSAIYEFVQNRK
ncbi:MAG: Polyphosphate kinase [Chitinophagaceae bacterium]|nr:Polyphosphate kinase [Chitinophagaceae bacterium]